MYRIFCICALLMSVYLTVDYLFSRTFDYRVFLMFCLMVIVIVWGIVDWRKNYLLMQKQEIELKLYEHYVKPLEELVKEIRVKQHEFDNHMNAILNMHLTVDNYRELVERQSEYITEVVRDDDSRQYVTLLRISDKVLAGFLYSKLVCAPEYVKTEIEVKSLEILSGIPEHHLIEIVGTLVDNAYEACDRERNRVMIEVDSENDKLVFSVRNQLEESRLSEVGRFFEKGYSTKKDGGNHGLGLYNAKMLIQKYKGDIFVCTDREEEKSYLCIRVVV